MKIGIMQPYFFPYIGYWQLISAVDKFIIYDNIKFTKKSWIRRNRILVSGKEKLITLPINDDSDFLNIKERSLSNTFNLDRKKILNQIKMAYQKAPYFSSVYNIIVECLNYNNMNLFDYIYYSIIKTCEYLDIDTEIIISSSIDMDHTLQNKARIIEICNKFGGDIYINPIGGIELYDKKEFLNHNISLKFINTDQIYYKQFDNLFVPNLSMIDILMFNTKEQIKDMLCMYHLV